VAIEVGTTIQLIIVIIAIGALAQVPSYIAKNTLGFSIRSAENKIFRQCIDALKKLKRGREYEKKLSEILVIWREDNDSLSFMKSFLSYSIFATFAIIISGSSIFISIFIEDTLTLSVVSIISIYSFIIAIALQVIFLIRNKSSLKQIEKIKDFWDKL